VNKWRVSLPVLGLIDTAAAKAEFDPIPSVKMQIGKPMLEAQKPKQGVFDEDDLEDVASAV